MRIDQKEGSYNPPHTGKSKIRNMQKEREEQQKKNRRKIAIFIGVIVMIAVVIILALTLGGEDSSQGVDGKYGKIIEGNPTIMDIGSTSCIPCQKLQPVLTSLGKKYNGYVNIKFYDCWNTTVGANMANKYDVATIPTLIFLDGNGVEVARMEGYNSQSTIEAKMKSLGWV